MIPFLSKVKAVQILLACLTGLCSVAAAQSSADFTRAAFVKGADTMQYRLRYPKHYNKNKHYPLVVYLHGDGERGNDNEHQLHAVPKAPTDSTGRIRYPCFILAPQCPKKRLWVRFPNFPESLQATPEPTLPAQWTLELIGQLSRNLPIDQGRIYLTGYSGGGEGTFEFLMRRPGLFAAAVPVCSVSDTAKAGLISRIPIWAFHGDRDEVNNVRYSRFMIAALQKAGGHPRYTEYAGMGHGIVSKAYQEPGLFDWLFAQKKQKP